jgi:5-methylthioadenosine/S-adenosylhomocysteine deaminase
MSLHAEYTNVEHYCRYVGEFAAEQGLRMHIHLSETQSEHEACIARHGKTPTRFFLDTGVLDVPTMAAHCVYVTDEDMDILREKGVTAAHCPVSNLKLGSGVMPLRKLLDKGVSVAFGTDGAASNNSLDVLRELQTAAILHKGISRAPESIRAEELLPLASETCARAQGRADCGRMQVGCRADLILCDLNALHNIPSYGIAGTVAYSMRGDDVLMTMCDGRILYENGAYTCLDTEELRAKATEVLGHYFD